MKEATNKLRPRQLTMLLCTSAAFSLMCYSAAYSLELLCGTVLTILLELVLCIPGLLLFREQDAVLLHCEENRWLCLAFCLYFLVRGGRSVLQLWNASGSLALPFDSTALAVVLIAGVCLYTATLGIRTLSRASTVVFGILLFTFFIMLTGAYQAVELQELSFSPEQSLREGIQRQLLLADEVPLLVLLMGFLEKGALRSTLSYFGWKLGFWSFLLFLGVTVLGSFMAATAYPFFMIANVSQPFSTQRADALYLVVFVLLCVMRLTLFTTVSAHLLKIAIPRLNACALLCLIGILGFAGCFLWTGLPQHWLCFVPAVLLGSGVPLWYLVKSRKRKAEVTAV